MTLIELSHKDSDEHSRPKLNQSPLPRPLTYFHFLLRRKDISERTHKERQENNSSIAAKNLLGRM